MWSMPAAMNLHAWINTVAHPCKAPAESQAQRLNNNHSTNRCRALAGTTHPAWHLEDFVADYNCFRADGAFKALRGEGFVSAEHGAPADGVVGSSIGLFRRLSCGICRSPHLLLDLMGSSPPCCHRSQAQNRVAVAATHDTVARRRGNDRAAASALNSESTSRKHGREHRSRLSTTKNAGRRRVPRAEQVCVIR
jgi:hypothetical protein